MSCADDFSTPRRNRDQQVPIEQVGSLNGRLIRDGPSSMISEAGAVRTRCEKEEIGWPEGH
jgi:hypothetical protein